MTALSGLGALLPADRFDLAVQLNRVRVFALATLVAFAFKGLDLIAAGWLVILAIGGTATSPPSPSPAGPRGLHRRWRWAFDPLWIR
jgi:hypothetical protein